MSGPHRALLYQAHDGYEVATRVTGMVRANQAVSTPRHLADPACSYGPRPILWRASRTSGVMRKKRGVKLGVPDVLVWYPREIDHDGLCDQAQAAWFQQATCDPRNSIWHSEIDPNLLMQEHWYFGDFSECVLIDHSNYLDFDTKAPAVDVMGNGDRHRRSPRPSAAWEVGPQTPVWRPFVALLGADVTRTSAAVRATDALSHRCGC
jgi:hypothetical protein